MFLLLLAALSNVDQSQLEAAEIDGAGFLVTFRKIILPAIRPVLAIAVLIRGLDLFRLFDIVWALTGRPRHDDRDDLDLRLRPGLPAVRDQLRRRHGVRHHRSSSTLLVILALRRVEIAR